MTRKLKIVDLFCGTGGFSNGFLTKSAAFELVYAIDLDENASRTARANHPKCRVDTGDIRGVDPAILSKELGIKQVDVVIGGPPCQGFSSLRPNRSTKNSDARNSLFRSFARFVDHFRPSVFVLENVVGLLTHDDGRTLEQVCGAFDRLGYSTDWRILNAASYGVPQKRERFILIGSRDQGPIVFPSPTRYFNGKVIGHADKSRFLMATPSLPRAVTVTEAIDDLPALTRGETADHYTGDPCNDYQRLMRGNATRLTLHKAPNHSDKMLEVIKHAGDSIACIPPHLISSGFSSCYSRLNGDEPSTTITVKFQSPASSKCIHPTQHRTITPREAARIQSFPDDYVFSGPLTQIACQLGNAVPPLLGQAIASSILDVVGEH